MPELNISTDQVGFLIVKAREFDAKEGLTDPDAGSNGSDDKMIDVLESDGRDAVVQEITGFLNALSRGDGSAEEWDTIRAEAIRGATGHPARYLLGEPMLGDLLAEGLSELGLSYTDGDRITPVA
jgi:hypothetical protein